MPAPQNFYRLLPYTFTVTTHRTAVRKITIYVNKLYTWQNKLYVDLAKSDPSLCPQVANVHLGPAAHPHRISPTCREEMDSAPTPRRHIQRRSAALRRALRRSSRPGTPHHRRCCLLRRAAQPACCRSTEELFAAEAMEAVAKDLVQMKVAELKEELEARGEAKTGAKAWLRRRLHAAIVRAHLQSGDAGDGWPVASGLLPF